MTKSVSAATSVQSVGKLFSSLFGSVAFSATSPTRAPRPPPLPPLEVPSSARPTKESLTTEFSVAAEHWQSNGASTSTEHAVVVRKAKVRDGVEIETPGDARSAALVGTLEEGSIVVVLASERAKDGTARTKVRSRVMDTTSAKPMVVGWVSTKLLRPFIPANGPPDGTSLNNSLKAAEADDGLTMATAPDNGGASASSIEEGLESADTVEYEVGDGPVHRLLESVADFMAQTVHLIKDACEADLVRIAKKNIEMAGGKNQKNSAAMSEDELEGVVDSAVWRQVEAEVFVPLRSRIEAAVMREVAAEASRASAKLRALKALPQAFWSIPPKHQSPSAFKTAVTHLNAIPKACLPSEKVDLLLLAVAAAERLCEDEHPLLRSEPSIPLEPDPLTGELPSLIEPNKVEERQPLGADDLFPIFVYMLVQSDLWKGGGLVVLRELLSGLANPERQRWSGSAYYVATLEAAIEHIKAT